MITYRKGDILQSGLPVIMHGCNMQGVMGAGLAKQIKSKYPKSYIDYVNELPSKHLGDIIWSEMDDTIIIHALTQIHYGRDHRRYVSYEAIERAMIKALERMDAMFGKDSVLAMPKIGCGLANGRWKSVLKVIEPICMDYDVQVFEL